MTLRSMLFVPGDSDRKLQKAVTVPADAVICDLEDAVAPARLPAARELVRDLLLQRHDRTQQQLWVRINPLQTPLALPDLAAVVRGAPCGIVLPKVESAAQCADLDRYLTALEHREGLAPGRIRIVAMTAETPQSMLTFDSWRQAPARVLGLTWGAEDLATALGATGNRSDDGEFEFTYRLARSLCLVAAHAAGLQAIDTITLDWRDADALRRDVQRARREGFTGKLAIHPDQVAAINAAFTPTAEELARAHRVVAAFAASEAGVFMLDGRMLDRPHLLQAQRIIAAASR